MDITGLAGLGDDRGAHALADAGEVVMNSADGEQRGDGHLAGRCGPI